MLSRTWRLRLAALIGAGAFGVHQLRFALAFGERSAHQLAAGGHAYLTLFGPALMLVLLLVAGEFAAHLARGGEGIGTPPGLKRTWALSAICLIAFYSAQELLEGAAAPGHAHGLTGVFGSGGWIALPLACAIGLAIALLMRGAISASTWVARRRAAAATRRIPRSSPIPALRARYARDPFCRFLAPRGPPLAS